MMGKSKVGSSKQAKKTVETYDDLMFRREMNGSPIDPCFSPDVIPYDNMLVKDPVEDFLKRKWNKEVGVNIEEKVNNFIYVRGVNSGNSYSKGRVFVYHTNATLTPWPADPNVAKSGWRFNKIKSMDGKHDYVDVHTGAKRAFVSLKPFLFKPRMRESEQVFVLVSRIVTARHRNLIEEPDNLMDLADYLHSNPNTVLHNGCSINPSMRSQAALLDYVQGRQSGVVRFAIDCENVPKGAQVELKCIHEEGKEEDWISKTKIANQQTFTISTLRTIEENFRGKLRLCYYSNGELPEKTMIIKLSAMIPLLADDILYPLGKEGQEYGESSDELRKVMLYEGEESIRLLEITNFRMRAEMYE